jgi:2-C-methyl-D-erythritol 4-phosphate cytidylyltransferase
MRRVSVIIPAAGSGQRFGGDENKIFARLGKGPMFLRTLEAFCNRSDVCQTILVCSPDDLPAMNQTYGGHLSLLGVDVVEGGATRSDSVRNALAIVSEEATLIAVHDAARPCVAGPWIDRVFDMAESTGAALLAVPVHGTCKRVDAKHIVTETPVRTGDLWEAQTPQVFSAQILRDAYAAHDAATDDAALVEAAGHPVTAVPGDLRNIKVTTADDLHFARDVIGTIPSSNTNNPFGV